MQKTIRQVSYFWNIPQTPTNPKKKKIIKGWQSNITIPTCLVDVKDNNISYTPIRSSKTENYGNIYHVKKKNSHVTPKKWKWT